MSDFLVHASLLSFAPLHDTSSPSLWKSCMKRLREIHVVRGSNSTAIRNSWEKYKRENKVDPQIECWCIRVFYSKEKEHFHFVRVMPPADERYMDTEWQQIHEQRLVVQFPEQIPEPTRKLRSDSTMPDWNSFIPGEQKLVRASSRQALYRGLWRHNRRTNQNLDFRISPAEEEGEQMFWAQRMTPDLRFDMLTPSGRKKRLAAMEARGEEIPETWNLRTKARFKRRYWPAIAERVDQIKKLIRQNAYDDVFVEDFNRDPWAEAAFQLYAEGAKDLYREKIIDAKSED